MIFNNYMFEEHEFYTFLEVYKKLQLSGNKVDYFTNILGCDILSRLGLIITTQSGGKVAVSNSLYDLSFIQEVENYYSTNAFKGSSLPFLNKLLSRYKNHYAIDCLKDDDIEEKSKDFMIKLFNLLDYTFVKYDTLLSLYASEKSHLLDKLGRTRTGQRQLASNVSGNETTSGTSSGTTSQTGAETTSGTSSSSSTKDTLDLHNDTPQTTDVVATITENQYVSDLRKIHETGSESGQTGGTSNNTSQGTSSGQTSSTGTSQTASTGSDEFTESEMWDTKTMMEKLDEIEKNFSNLIKKWLNEFDELFIEEVNY